ncbi:hypothetical protein GCM10023115_31550 [Pontixanthobacter gangjinensis]|uniref:DUF3955 domain-containing protein n=1 Tax=Christiangramia aestuarii TaxID=1028746 RepID=A0A7K1LNK0_9FLAO|nr:hypothetical protein [Christiangramia aestuarii]MUP42385.1 hypothetical protein [Christiangramia aestuarii]
MNKYTLGISLLTLMFGFTFYGEIITINLGATYYLIPAEVICFGIWLIFMIIFWISRLRKILSKNEA